MSSKKELTRRNFVTIVVVAGSGLALGCVPNLNAKGSSKPGPESTLVQTTPFVAIGTNGLVTITAPRPDMGQGVRTSLAMIVAEELGVDWSSVRVVQAPGGDRQYGSQGVGGSSSVRGSYDNLRLAGATAGHMLKQAAAAQWNVDPSTCSLNNGFVESGGKRLAFKDLATAAAKLPVPSQSEVKLKPRGEFKIIGKPTKRVDNGAVVTGKAIYGIDARPANAKVAVIARPPAFGATIKSFKDTAALAIPGVRKVFQMGSGIAVVADDTWAAMQGRDALEIDWDRGPNANLNSAEISKRLLAEVGAFPAQPEGAKQTIRATYELPFLSHMPLEPMNCTAWKKGDSLEIWVPTQLPEAAKGTAAQASKLSQDQVTVHVTLVGGGFGRRLSQDYVSEAVQIAMQVEGPVQTLWSRDDDLQHDNYRPANLHAFEGSIDANGDPLSAYQQAILAGGRSRGGQFGGYQAAYDLPHGGTRSGGVATPVPTGAWRSVENTYQCFVTESFLDELCAAGGKDPLEVRLKLIKDDRLRACLSEAAKRSGWGSKLPAGRGRGIACFSGYGSCIAQIAEVTVTKGRVKVDRVVAVVDCGLAINPLGVKAQIQGAVTDGIATTLHSQITIENGGVFEANPADFGWATMGDDAKVEVTILEGGDRPGGMGEVGYPASLPAICNAIFAATGKRIRKLPIRDQLA